MLRVLLFACTLALLSTIPSFADIGGDDVLASGPTTFNYALPTAAMIELAIFDVQGRRVWNVMKPEHPEGNHTLQWNGKDQWGRDVNPGVYFARMRATGSQFSNVETQSSGRTVAKTQTDVL